MRMSKFNTTKMPSHISCPECKDEGKFLMHVNFMCELEAELGDQWTWHLMNHDNTSKFQWPETFPTKKAAQRHINSFVGEDSY